MPVIIGIISDPRKRKEHGRLRIVFDARDGGCTRPGCLTPGYYSEVHHSPTGHRRAPPTPTNCSSPAAPTTALLTSGHYRAEVTDTGRLAWTDGTQPPDINHGHDPEELLHGNTDPPDEDEK